MEGFTGVCDDYVSLSKIRRFLFLAGSVINILIKNDKFVA